MGWLRRMLGSKGAVDEGGKSSESVPTVASGYVAPAANNGKSAPFHITREVLKQLFPVRNLSDEEVDAFALDRAAEAFDAGTVLFRRDEEACSIFYLLEGTVQMDVAEGASYAVQSNTAKARFPLCSGKRYSATGTARTPVKVLRVSPKIMQRHGCGDDASRLTIDVHKAAIPETVRASKLFQAFCQYYRDEELTIPTLPDVAIKLRRAMEKSADLTEVVDIIHLDPAIAGKVVRVANSPLYLSANPIQNLRDAVLRLGLAVTRNLVMSYSLQQIFQCKGPYINRMLHEEWTKSVYLSSLCFVLATENRGVDAEAALLAGLIADIGVVPFLYFAENFPREYWSPDDVLQALPWIRGPVGAYVLSRWNFPVELAEIPLRAEDWFHDSGPTLQLSDIVVLSRLHAHIGMPRMAELPAINSIPACGKLQNGDLSPEFSLRVLHEAKDKISRAMVFFEA